MVTVSRRDVGEEEKSVGSKLPNAIDGAAWSMFKGITGHTKDLGFTLSATNT